MKPKEKKPEIVYTLNINKWECEERKSYPLKGSNN